MLKGLFDEPITLAAARDPDAETTVDAGAPPGTPSSDFLPADDAAATLAATSFGAILAPPILAGARSSSPLPGFLDGIAPATAPSALSFSVAAAGLQGAPTLAASAAAGVHLGVRRTAVDSSGGAAAASRAGDWRETGRADVAATAAPPAVDMAALATTQPHQIDFSSGPMGVFGADTSFSFSLPSSLFESFSYSTGVSVAGFGVKASVSLFAGLKGSVNLSLGQFTPDYPVTIDPGVTPFVQDGQVFSVDPSLVSTNDAQFSLSLPQANASLEFGLGATDNLTFSFPGIPIGVSLPFIGFVGYTIHIPSLSINFGASRPTLSPGNLFKLKSNTTINVYGVGTVTMRQLEAKTISSGPLSAYQSLPTLEVSGDTSQFFAGSLDLVKLLAKKIPAFAALANSKSFAGGLASLGYELFGLPISGALWLHEDVTLTPVAITETVTDELNGQSQTGTIGQSFNFTAPASGADTIPLSISFGLELSVHTELDLDGHFALTLDGPSVSASVLGVSETIGPLGKFTLFSVSGLIAPLYSNTFTDTLTTTDTVDVQTFTNPVTQTVSASSGAVSLTKPGADLMVAAKGTVSGAGFGVQTGTLSSAMIEVAGLITATGYGVQLQEGGTVNIDPGGRILGHGSAPAVGVLAAKNPFDAVVNEGVISGFAQAVVLGGGSVKNDDGATISGASMGVSIASAGASIVNNGSIHAATAISLAAGGSLYNAASGTITAGSYGVYAAGALALENHCTLTGGGDAIRAIGGGDVANLDNAYVHGGAVGVILDGAGDETLSNGVGATITGGKIGVSLRGANVTVVDEGLISGSLAAAQLYGTVSSTLVLDPAAQLTGGVQFGSAAATLSLVAGSGGVGTVTGIGGSQAFRGEIGTIAIGAGAAWDVGGDFTGVTVSGLTSADRLDDTAIAYSAGERAVVNSQTDVLSIFAAGSPTVSVGTIQLSGPLTNPPTVTADGSGGIDIGFSAQKLTAVAENSGEVTLSPTSFFAPGVTIAAGVTVTPNYYGANAQNLGVYATGERATLTNYGSILSNSQAAVQFASGGEVANEAGALISGAVRLGSYSVTNTDAVTLTNAGTVAAGYGGAVYLNVPGTITNLASGQITSASQNGVQLSGPGSVSNSGSISGGRSAARLFAGGFVYNEASGVLTGQHLFGVEVSGAYGKVVNCGSIGSANYAGVYLSDGGLVVNETGRITSPSVGVKIVGGDGNVANAAYIEGIQLTDGGMVVNAATGTIGGAGIATGTIGGATVKNAGLVHGSGGVAVQLGSASDLLIVDAGARFMGAVQGGGGALELASGIGSIRGFGGAGTLSGAAAMTFTGFGSYSIDAGASWTLLGNDALAAGKTLTVAGALTLAGTLANAGTVSGTKSSTIALRAADLAGGSLISLGRVVVVGSGNILDGTTSKLTSRAPITIADGAALTLEGAIANSGTIAMVGKAAVTSVIVAAAGATLSGGGVVTLSSSTENRILGASSTAILTNAERITGGGELGGGTLKLVNAGVGAIIGTAATPLVIDTGANSIVNGGLISAAAGGSVTVMSAVNNGGMLTTTGGNLTLLKGVSGSGKAVANGGKLDLAAADSFTGGSTIEAGSLELGAAGAAGEGAIVFAPPAGGAATLILDAASTPFTAGVDTFGNTLSNFGTGDFIDIAGLAYGPGASVSLSGHVMTVSSGGKTVNFTLAGTLPTKLLAVAGPNGGVQLNTEGISTQPELEAAFIAADETGKRAGLITLLICANIDLTTPLAPIELAKGVSLAIDGGGFTVSGVGARGDGLFIRDSKVSIKDLTFDGPLTNDGVAELGGRLTIAGAVSGQGQIIIDAGAEVEFGGAVDQRIRFAPGAQATLKFDDPNADQAVIRGFATGDTIDLAGIEATSWRRSGKDLILYDGAATVATLDLVGEPGRTAFVLSSDGAGGTDLTIGPPAHPASATAPFVQHAAAHGAQAAALAELGMGGEASWAQQRMPNLARP